MVFELCDSKERKKETNKQREEKRKKRKKKNKTDIFKDNFRNFERCYRKPGSTFYIRIVKGTCV